MNSPVASSRGVGIDALNARQRRLVVIAIAHDLGVKHRRQGESPLYLDASVQLARLAADTAGLEISDLEALRWSTAALIAYRGAYDAAPQQSPLANVRSPAPARSAGRAGTKRYALPNRA